MDGKGIHIASRIAGGILVVLCACVLALRSKAVQNRIIRLVENKLAAVVDADVSFSSFKLTSYGSLLLTDILVKDRHPYTEDRYGKGYAPTDTILYAGNISATFTLKGLLSNEGFHLGRLNVTDGGLFIVSEPAELTGRSSNFESLTGPAQPIDSNFVAQPGPNLFDVRRVKVDNFRFRLINFIGSASDDGDGEASAAKKKKETERGINYEDMDVTASVRAHNLRMAGGKMYGVVDHLEGVEKSGFRLKDVTGRAEVGLGKALVTDLHIVTGPSDVRLDSFSMSFKNMLDFRDFVNKVVFDAEFGRTRIAMATVNWFSDFSLGDNKLLFDIRSGTVHGPVNDIHVTGLEFTDLYSGMSGLVDANVGSIVPDVSQMFLKADARNVSFDSGDISEFLTCWAQAGGGKVDFTSIAPGHRFIAHAGCDGTINRLGVSASINDGEIGRLKADGVVYDILNKKLPISLKGHIVTEALAVNSIIGNDKLGLLDAEASVGLVLNESKDIRIDSLYVSRLNAIGHDFHDIRVKGSLADNTADIQFSSKDSALKASVVALADLKPFNGTQRYKLAAELGKVDLHALGLDKRGDSSSISGNLFGSFVKQGDIILGDAFIDKIKLVNDKGVQDIDEITLRAFQRNGDQNFKLSSQFADATFVGSEPLSRFIQDIQDLTIRRHLQAIPNKPPQSDSTGRYDLNLDFHDSRTLLAYVMPSLYVADSTNVSLSVRDGILQAGLSSPRIALGPKFLRKVSLDIDNLDNSLNAFLTTEEVNAGGIIVRDPAFAAYATDNTAEMSLQFDGISGSDSGGELFVDAEFSRDELDSLVIAAHPLNSYIRAGKDHWDFGRSTITLRGKDIDIDSLSMANGVQMLRIDGGISRSRRDTLAIALDSLNLKVLDEFLVNKLDINGITTGKAFITSPLDTELGMLLNFRCDSLNIGGQDVGAFRIASVWDEEAKRIRARLSNTLHNKAILKATGTYEPASRKLGVQADFDEFALGALAPLLSSVFSETGGSISGSISASGKADDISIGSKNLRLNNALIRLDYTGVPYTINGPIRIDDSGIYLERIEITDGSEGRGSLNGSLRYKKLKDIRLSARANLRDLKVIDVEERANSTFYGMLKASGNVSISGPLNALVVDADVSTAGDGDVHVPLSGALTSTSSNLLTYTEPERVLDPYEQMLLEYAETTTKAANDFTARGNVRINPGLTAFLEIDKSVGNVMNVSGDGTLGLEIRPSKNIFNLNGDYNIASGNYHFVLPGILEKDFEIQNDSYLRFGGELMNSQLDINAIHPVRTSLSTLLADSTVVSTRRLVECGLNISGRLSAPEINFSVDVPDLDPTTKSKVDGALNTEDKIQTQFVALLLAGTFLPSEQSGVFNSSNILYSNIGEVVSSQINNIFQKLSIPIDIGLGYQQQNTGNDIFDVAISTQLFNNRVVVNGTVGNRNKKYATSAGSSDIVGDLDIELKLDKEGKYRLSAFSHSADGNTNFLDNSQRNGVGISFQQEFNTLGELLRSIFLPAHKRSPQTYGDQGPMVSGLMDSLMRARRDSLYNAQRALLTDEQRDSLDVARRDSLRAARMQMQEDQRRRLQSSRRLRDRNYTVIKIENEQTVPDTLATGR